MEQYRDDETDCRICVRCGCLVAIAYTERHEKYHQRWENAERLARKTYDRVRHPTRRR